MSKENVQTCFRTSIGGQALIEGILMRGPDRQAIVCRTGEGMTEKVEELKQLLTQYIVTGRSTPGAPQENFPCENWPGLEWLQQAD